MNELQRLPALLLPWYEQNKRDLPWRKDREPYHIWISEIMLQQTRVEAVIGYYNRFLAFLPDVAALANVDEDTLLKLWEGLGYYNRARNLKKAATVVTKQHGGVFPRDAAALRALPGVGPYTAGAIGSICFNLPTPAVDGNVLRVFARLTELPDSIDKEATKKRVVAALETVYQTADHCGLLTQALMELGACVCVPNGNPKCGGCPLSALCLARRNGTWMHFPVRDPKKARKIEHRTVLLLRCGDRYAIRQRGAGGLLAKLWEFPNELEREPLAQEAALLRTEELAVDCGVRPTNVLLQSSYVHIFTHVEWHMAVTAFDCREMSDRFVWATQEELEQIYALPSAFRPCLELVKNLN